MLPTAALVFLGLSLHALWERPWSLTVFGILLAVASLWWLRNFFDQFLDAWIITDQAVIDIAWHGFFHRESSRILYSDIQGVSYEIKGVWPTLFRCGHISVEKVSSGGTFTLEHVPGPRRVEALILKNQEAYLHRKSLTDANQVHDMLVTLVKEHAVRQTLKK